MPPKRRGNAAAANAVVQERQEDERRRAEEVAAIRRDQSIGYLVAIECAARISAIADRIAARDPAGAELLRRIVANLRERARMWVERGVPGDEENLQMLGPSLLNFAQRYE